MTVIVDYGVGNLFSLKSSFGFIGEEALVTSSADVIKTAERIILPGVGAFGDAVEKLRRTGLDEAIYHAAEKGTPMMGICLGMQLLFDKSTEYGIHDGLSFISGTVRPINEVCDPALKVPHIGWNALRLRGEKHPIFKYINSGDHVYFVHSFYGADCDESVIADVEYGAWLTAAVSKNNVCGCQFHPEKSGEVGLNILRGFCEWNGK